MSIPIGYVEVALTCLATHFGYSGFSILWFRKTEAGIERVNSNVEVTENLISSELVFEDGFQSSDVGQYFCSVDGSASGSTEFTIQGGDSRQNFPPCPNETDFVFQIRMLDTHCNRWNSVEKSLMSVEFLHSLTSLVSYQCGDCPISTNDFTLADLSCNDGAALFKGASINPQITASVFCGLRNWHTSGSVLAIDNELYTVDRTCNLSLKSLSNPGCHASTALALNATAIYSVAVVSGILVLGLLCTFFTIFVIVIVKRQA